MSREVPLPYLEIVLGGVWWVVGALALSGGASTVVLAGGLGVTGLLLHQVRRAHGPGVPLAPAVRSRLLVVTGVTIGIVAAGTTGLAAVGWGELAAPAACALVGAVLVPQSTRLEARSLLGVGAAMLVLGAAGALLALDSAGRLYPQGMVGMVAAVLLWVAGAHRTGLLAELRASVRG